MREIRFGLVIPQGWSYDFVFNKEVEKQEENHNPIKQYEYSKTIAKTADKSQFESIYTFIIVKRFLKTSLEYQIQSFCDQMKVVQI